MLLGYLFIFAARVMDVSLFTIRMLLIVRGKRLQAAIIGFFEVIIYITALGKVVSGLSDYRNLIVYALGYACGNFIGSLIEEKLAIGKITAQIICQHCDGQLLAKKLRNNGFGVTLVEGEGRDGKRQILNVMLNRKDTKNLYNALDELENKPIVTVFDIRSIKGGYFTKMKRR
ncbi:DUF2179 domain-containing protein [Paramaledivibacter caminithermalis]|jgi:uncharacterized protein YebE (UPF0316 family)|uniref:UPF0316 protein SAMN02745912_01879 n=1 Tax=Paramaledivibacter caminithermalis (strain DSM 15212 / CIP 107654 / DViRD3) TaxID=1121301 RepID=A0A1M6NUE9_PARC5|nr:DUF2179 domain-containing protein [Paramaledivibacter caminithermalis]SHJ99359.1 Uncharacterized protein YebE, UPF0316 family [Paramaledivibacter caminithermalis DSM 15212]